MEYKYKFKQTPSQHTIIRACQQVTILPSDCTHYLVFTQQIQNHNFVNINNGNKYVRFGFYFAYGYY